MLSTEEIAGIAMDFIEDEPNNSSMYSIIRQILHTYSSTNKLSKKQHTLLCSFNISCIKRESEPHWRREHHDNYNY